ncbi:MAG: hypothetical protein ACXAE3_15245 [Candidatus Kariarchaeaceae archaeon]|jgi:hypothetical protein
MVSQVFSLRVTYEGEQRRLVLRKGPQETHLHILLKVLAYLFFWNRDLTIEPSFRHHGYRPDLLAMRPHPDPKIVEDEIDLWVECKQVKLAKLDDLVRYCNAPIYWFHTLRHLKRAVLPRSLKKFKRLSKVVMIGISEETRVLEQYLDAEWVILTDDDGNLQVYISSLMDPVLIGLSEFYPESP